MATFANEFDDNEFDNDDFDDEFDEDFEALPDDEFEVFDDDEDDVGFVEANFTIDEMECFTDLDGLEMDDDCDDPEG